MYRAFRNTDLRDFFHASFRDTCKLALILILVAPLAGPVAHAQDQGDTFKITPIRPVDEVRAEAMKASPPEEEGTFRESDLVDLMEVDAPFRFDIRYATDNNFMNAVLYPEARSFFQRAATEALLKASKEFEEMGYGIIIYDTYRPWFITKTFWDATPDSLKHFVADPASGSRHNRGSAVDMGLYDLETGELLEMPSGYDEFTERAYPEYAGGTEASRKNRELLREVMERNGFTVYPYEWWHYDFVGWEAYPIMNVPFDEIGE